MSATTSRQFTMDTLTWFAQSEGTDGGGLFATQPATVDRIEALRNLR